MQNLFSGVGRCFGMGGRGGGGVEREEGKCQCLSTLI